MLRYILDARTTTKHFPGIGRYGFNLAQAIIPLLQSDHLILLRDPTQSSPWNVAALAGEQVEVIDVPVSPFSLRQQWQIPQLLGQLKADLYHSPYYLEPYWPGAPTILTVYDLIPLRYPQYSSAQARLLFRWTTALALRTACHVIAISEATRRDLLATYRAPPSKVSTVLLAADPNFRPQSPENVTALRARLGLPEQYVLYVGSNKPHKNLARLVEAWARIQPQEPKLIIAGVWDTRYPQAKRRVEALGLTETVKFLGPVAEAELPALYSGAMAFVFPSEYEGFGLPVLEAMACGVPVACANTSSLPEVTGGGALMFNPVDVDEMAMVLKQLLGNAGLRTELRQQGVQRAKQLTWRRTAEETLAIYRKIVL